MLLEIYLILQFLAIVMFFVSFFSRQELLWVVTLVMTGILMMSSSTIEIFNYTYNTTSGAYDGVTTVFYYPYLMGINLLFFALALLFGIHDVWDKFGLKIAEKAK